jgi:hypothetical protein
MDTTNLANVDHAPVVEWGHVESRLERGIPQAPGSGGPGRHTCWLTTINPDGSPHVTAVGSLWGDGAFWFQTGDDTRKGRNLAHDPRCTLSIATDEFDLVVAGEASKVTVPDIVAKLVERWADGGWPVEVDESGFALTAEYSAPSAGAPPWFAYRLAPRTATVVGTKEPFHATKWRF